MKWFWLLLILFQIGLAAALAFRSTNVAGISYRHVERTTAIHALAEHPSPETKAAAQNEMRLAAKHVSHQQLPGWGILTALFLVFDAAGYYGWKNFRKNFGYKTPAA